MLKVKGQEKLMIKAAIIGLGWWGSHIVNTLQGKSDKITFVRGVDVTPDAVSSFAQSNGIEVTSDFVDVVSDPDLNAIVIATPHSLHEEQIVAAAEAGKHVFCEKPLALTLASAERSVAACNEAGVVLGIGHERRFEPAMQEIARLVESSELGDIMHVEANFSHDKLANLNASNWRVSSIESPAAAMTATGIHITDAYVNMFGPVKQLFAMTAKRNPANANGDILNFNLRFKSGATGSFNSVLETPLYLRYAVFGSKAWVEARDYSHPSEPGTTDLFISKSEGDIEKKTYKSVDTVRLNFEAWADAIYGIADYPFSSAQKLENIAVFEAICQSAQTGLPINL
jgi:predicted dehydrogenase